MFWTLPQEVFDMIVREVRYNDVVALSQVSKNLHSTLEKAVWKGVLVDLRPTKKHRLDPNKIPRCAAALEHASPATRRAAHLTFRCAFTTDYFVKRRCLHFPSDLDYTSREEKVKFRQDRQGRFDTILGGAVSIVESLRENQLCNFSWDVGTCVPPQLIQALARRHPQLESLQLVTDYMCPSIPDGDDCMAVDLSPFRHLRRISWVSPPGFNLQPLGAAIRNNRLHLEDLELGFPGYGHVVEDVAPPGTDLWTVNLLVDVVLSTRKYQSPGTIFPSLQALTLSYASFYNASSKSEILRVVDFSSLKSLTLRCCHDWGDFLAALRTSGTPINLRALEIVSSLWSDGDSEIAQFVESFEGLEQLSVSFLEDNNARINRWTPREPRFHLWRSLNRHRATLRRFIYHKRFYRWSSCGRARSHVRFDDLRECSTLGIPEMGLEAQALQPGMNPLSGLDLECLGLSCKPDLLRPLLQPFTAKSTLKIFHLRQTQPPSTRSWHAQLPYAVDIDRISGAEEEPKPHAVKTITHDALQDALTDGFRDLLDWAFGPDGIRSLQVVAFGDFAHGRNGKYLYNLFVCRSGSESGGKDGGRAYRVFDARDAGYRDVWEPLVRPYGRFLEACPVAEMHEREPTLY